MLCIRLQNIGSFLIKLVPDADIGAIEATFGDKLRYEDDSVESFLAHIVDRCARGGNPILCGTCDACQQKRRRKTRQPADCGSDLGSDCGSDCGSVPSSN